MAQTKVTYNDLTGVSQGVLSATEATGDGSDVQFWKGLGPGLWTNNNTITNAPSSYGVVTITKPVSDLSTLALTYLDSSGDVYTSYLADDAATIEWSASIQSESPINVSVSSTPPSSPSVNDLWVDLS